MRALTSFAMRALTAAILLALPQVSFAMPPMPGMDAPAPRQPVPGTSIYNLNDVWTSQSDTPTPLRSLRGSVVVAAMVYTRCRDVCPLTTEAMQRIERAMPVKKRACVRFVLFSMDWVADMPAQLRAYASAHRLSDRWTLLHGDENAVRGLSAALGISLYREPNGDYQHSLAIFVLDGEGRIAATETDLLQKPAILANKARDLVARRCSRHRWLP